MHKSDTFKVILLAGQLVLCGGKLIVRTLTSYAEVDSAYSNKKQALKVFLLTKIEKHSYKKKILDENC